MNCVICHQQIKQAEHIAIDDEGNPMVMCESCYDKCRPFFEEVRRHGRTNS